MSHLPPVPEHHQNPGWKWWAFALAVGTVLVLGCIGFMEHERETQGHASLSNAAFHTVQLFILHFPPDVHHVNLSLEVARWLATGIVGAATLLALWRVFGAEWRHLRLQFTDGHTVICGMGRRGMALARSLAAAEPDKRVVVVDHRPSHEVTELCGELGVPLVAGDCRQELVLKRARVAQAGRVIVVTGSDAANLETVQAVKLCCKQRPSGRDALPCYLQLADAELGVAIRQSALMEPRSTAVEVRFFDIYQTVARKLLADHLRLDGTGIHRTDPTQSHLVILGFGRMGRALAVKAAQLGHFANGKSVRISVLDRHAQRHERELLFRYPGIRSTCTIEFHECEAACDTTREQLQKWCQEPDTRLNVAICFDNDALALDIALRLRFVLREFSVPVAVQLSASRGLAPLLGQEQLGDAPPLLISPFSAADDELDFTQLEDAARDRIARVIHERYLAQAGAKAKEPGNLAGRPWDELNEFYKDSNRQQADHLLLKLRAIGCEPAPLADSRKEVACEAVPDGIPVEDFVALASMEHDRWNAEKFLAGWAYAPGKKSEARRTNSNLQSWDALSEEVKGYDYTTIRSIPVLLQLSGQKVVRCGGAGA